MFQRQKSDTKLRRTPSFFTEARHLAEPVEVQPSQEWRVKSTRTHGGVLAVCLNAEVEPPDCVFPRALRTGAGRLLCGIDPLGASQAEQRKVVGRIGRQLELQYEQLHGSRSTVFKQCLDPTVEALHRACRRQRREARDEALLFHFCGHGVPAPSELGEIWLFNDSYTEYVPVRAADVAEWLGGPGGPVPSRRTPPVPRASSRGSRRTRGRGEGAMARRRGDTRARATTAILIAVQRLARRRETS